MIPLRLLRVLAGVVEAAVLDALFGRPDVVLRADMVPRPPADPGA